MNDIIFRLAQVGDAKEIYDIYAPYVANTAFTFEYEAPGIPALMDRIINTMNTYPYIVCLIDGHVAAYTYASRHMVRAAYQWNAELSVYVDGRFRGMGIGTALYTAIIEVLKLQNVQNIFACISRDNTSSRRLHENMGFEIVGLHRNAGYKLGKWHDIVWMERCIGTHDADPKAFKGIQEIDGCMIDEILKRNISLCRPKIAG